MQYTTSPLLHKVGNYLVYFEIHYLARNGLHLSQNCVDGRPHRILKKTKSQDDGPFSSDIFEQ